MEDSNIDPTNLGPLDGVRVLDLTAVVMGPYSTQILADLGADVITVENSKGDSNRVMGKGPHLELSGVALNLLRNKRNVTLDVKHVQGRAALLKIAESCDVFVTNVRAGGLERAGLAYEDVVSVNPKIIYCEAHGYPLDSAERDRPAYDDIMQAESGLADVMLRQNGVPSLMPTLIADKVCGLAIAYAISAALFQRERTGKGSHIEVPMIDVVRSWVLVEHGAAGIPVPAMDEAGYQRILTPNRRPQRTKDAWIQVLPYGKPSYEALFGKGGRPDLVGDPRYATLRDRIANASFLYEQVAEVLLHRTTDEWLTFCRENDIPAAPVTTLETITETYPVIEHPVAGPYHHVPSPIRFDSATLPLRRPAPLIGQHTDEVLSEIGYSPREIAELHRSGAVPEPPSSI
jgi:crotonobetainyl-CoA:carnitine CoA-transferase CaiB-like acyl-CoA transferase